jgi:C4-dicarboxylate transporter DctQ subunit
MRALRFVLTYLEEIAAVALLVALCAATIANVVGRYMFNSPVPWAEEFARYAFIWLVFIGAASCSKHRRHIAIDILVLNASDRVRQVMRITSDIATFALMAVLVYYGTRLALRAAYPTATLGIRTTYVYMIVPISALLVILRMLPGFRDALTGADKEART